ncbi:MAG: SDR family oxidoreductase [Novosphingobium sp.]|nr:SDR family oxidoreductase [Novosphingobium sp.]
MREPPFADAAALIYGGGKGIGRAVALEWAARGARLAVADLDESAAEDTAQTIRDRGGEAVALRCDVLSDSSVAAAGRRAEEALGPLEIVMNNVGGMLNGHPEDVPFREWQRMIDLNYLAVVRGIGEFLPQMLERGAGHLVCTASFAGFYPYAASRVPYAAAKAAVIALAENLAIYCEPQGVRVSCLIPGPVMTGVMESMTSWTLDAPMRGPGAELELKIPDEVATTLADGMRDGRVLIPSDPAVWEIVRRWAADPEAFIHAKIAEFAAGESGRPRIPEALLKAMDPAR